MDKVDGLASGSNKTGEHVARIGIICGTVAAIGGIRPAPGLEMELHDPRNNRAIRHQYHCELLPVVA